MTTTQPHRHFQKSTVCWLKGLQSMPSMNGKKCRIVGPLNEQEQRYPVFVYDTKDVVLIKPTNLIIAATNHQNSNAAQFKSANIMDGSLLKSVTFRLKDNTTILYFKYFLTQTRAEELREELSRTLSWEQPNMPRLQSWMHDEGITNQMASLFQKQPGYLWSHSPSMLCIKNTLERVLQCRFHYVLINRYRDKNDSIGWHSDGEAKSRCRNVVASISLGGPRTFILRHNNWKQNSLKKEFELSSGCLLVMKDDTQRYWKHSVPKSRTRVNPRINLTFRQVCRRGCCSRSK